MKLKFCENNENKELYEKFNNVIRELNITNVFNPSFHVEENFKIFTFRAIPKSDKELTSYLYIKDKNDEAIMNISDLSKEFNEPRFIDPKIFKANNEFYITFNTGWSENGNNIYVMKIYPILEKPIKVTYQKRNKYERNWAFFSENNEIYALYSINPLKILKLKENIDEYWEFEDFYSGEKNEEDELSIGTQLTKYNEKYYFVGHKKMIVKNKKVYLGKLCEFDFNNKDIKLNEEYLIHSFESLFGDEIKHNTNLLSCTYFSGIQIKNGIINLGYGINDVDYRFSNHKLNFKSREKIFEEIYKEKKWGGNINFYSGRGSEDFNSKEYIEYVNEFIKKNNISSIVDLGCGDFRVGKQLNLNNIEYIGIDVVQKLIDFDNEKFGNKKINFIKKDIVEEELPNGELCLIRQVLQHLSNEDILKVLKKYKYVLITNGLPIIEPKKRNVDKPTDRDNRWDKKYKSGLYLESPPFNQKVEITLNYFCKNKNEKFRTLLLK